MRFEAFTMKNLMLIVSIGAGLMMLLTGLPVWAHHSLTATYDVSKQITLKGKIVEVSLRSPHSIFLVEAEDNQGVAQMWSIEGGAAGQFAKQGVTKDTFKVGDPIEIIANPARNESSYRGRLIKITRTTDGKSWGGRAGETVD